MCTICLFYQCLVFVGMALFPVSLHYMQFQALPLLMILSVPTERAHQCSLLIIFSVHLAKNWLFLKVVFCHCHPTSLLPDCWLDTSCEWLNYTSLIWFIKKMKWFFESEMSPIYYRLFQWILWCLFGLFSAIMTLLSFVLWY